MSAVYDKQALLHFLSLIPDNQRKELSVVTPDQLQQSHLLHMSRDNGLQNFTPAISARVLNGENRSIPRICTAPTLVGCVLGHASDISDYTGRNDGSSVDQKKAIPFKGGWILYGFEFDVALRPSRRLVEDVERTDEHWLVSYDDETVKYKPVKLAKFFYQSVSFVATGSVPRTDVEMLVEVLTDIPVRFDRKTTLGKGCWKVKCQGFHNASRWDKVATVETEKMLPVDYNNAKRLVASMLSFEDVGPPSSRW